MPQPLNAVIFDHDGTLVNSEPVHHACWLKAIEQYNAEFSLDEYVTYLTGIPSSSSAQWIIERFKLPTDPATLYARKQAHVDEYLQSHAFPLMPHAESLVRYCFEAGLKLAVASGAGAREIHRSLNAHGLNRWIKVVASKNDVARNKPAPDVYLLAIEQLGESANGCIAIEDSNVGQAAALAANLTCLRLHPVAPHPQVVGVRSLEDAKAW
ncbi:MAG TPA: HAD family phosphatase, partial [Cellvibrionaceae bacterium]|nr:HAD family phosphatase [Cellvibrionaceae bacterium]